VAYDTLRGDAAAVMRKASGPGRASGGDWGAAERMLVYAPCQVNEALERAASSPGRQVKAYRSSFSVFASVHPRGLRAARVGTGCSAAVKSGTPPVDGETVGKK